VIGFNEQLPSWNKIWKEIRKQEKEIAQGQLTVPTGVIGNIVDPNIRINQVQGLAANVTPAASVAPVSKPVTTVQPALRRRRPPVNNPSVSGAAP
jgi:hypothetical protein